MSHFVSQSQFSNEGEGWSFVIRTMKGDKMYFCEMIQLKPGRARGVTGRFQKQVQAMNAAQKWCRKVVKK